MNNANDTQALIRRSFLIVLTLALFACGGGKNDLQMVQAAKGYLEQNKMREAAIELKNALQKNPENAEARYMLGQINLDVGDTAAAEKEFRRAGKAGWPEDEVMVGLATAMNYNNAYQKTLDQVSVKESYPSMSRASLYGLRAIAYVGLGELDQANNSLFSGMSIEPDAFHILKAGIQLQLAAKNVDRADGMLTKALTKFPDNQQLLLLSAVTAKQSENQIKAIEAYSKVIELDPIGVVTVYGRKARLEKASIEILEKNFSQAEANLKPLFKQNPDDPLTNYMGGMLAYEQGNLQIAEERLLKVLKVAPDHAETLLLFGTVKYAQEDYEQAAHYLGRYVSVAPENLGARKLLGRTYMMLGQHNEARETLQQGVQAGAEDAELLALVGLLNIQGGNAVSGIDQLEKAVKAAPENTSLRDELARAYITAGQAENAIQLLNSILAEEGDQQQTEALLVYAHLREGHFDKAIDAVMGMLEKQPKDPAILTLAGSVFASSGDEQAARKYYNNALQQSAKYLPASMALARLEELDGNIDIAIALYEGIAGPEVESIQPLMALARVAEVQDRTQDMLEWLEKAREKAPKDINPRVSLAEFYLRDRQADKADIYINETVKIAPHNNIVLALRGKVLMAQGQYNEVLSPLNELIANAPESVYARVLIGETYLKLGQTMRARKQLEVALEKQPYSVSALALMATVELQLGNYKGALDYAEKIQKVEPEQYMGYEIAGDALIMSNNNSEAKIVYEEAWKRSQSADLAIKLSEVSSRIGQSEEVTKFLHEWLDGNPDDARVLQFLGQAYQNNGQEKMAIQTYEKALGVDPDNVVVLNNLAWLHSKADNPRALELAERAHKASPGDGGVLDTYGWILVQHGQVEKGRRILEQAMEQLSEVPEVQYHYAVALLESGEKIAARKILQKLLDEEKTFEGRDDASRLLQ